MSEVREDFGKIVGYNLCICFVLWGVHTLILSILDLITRFDDVFNFAVKYSFGCSMSVFILLLIFANIYIFCFVDEIYGGNPLLEIWLFFFILLIFVFYIVNVVYFLVHFN